MPETASRGRKQRGPIIPFIALEKAVERAKEFYKREGRHAAPLAASAQHWSYSPTSSGAHQTISAMKQFGLLDDFGRGEQRKLKLSELAMRIILDDVPNSQERSKAIQEAALEPKIFREMFNKWGMESPSYETIRTFLRRDKAVNKDSLNAIVRNYTDTLEYAKLSESDKIPPDNPGFEDGGDDLDGKMINTDSATGKERQSPVVSREVFSLGDGVVTLEWPNTLDSDGLADVEDWLKVVLKKLKRLKSSPSKTYE